MANKISSHYASGAPRQSLSHQQTRLLRDTSSHPEHLSYIPGTWPPGSRQLARRRAGVVLGPVVWGAGPNTEPHCMILKAGSALTLAGAELGFVMRPSLKGCNRDRVVKGTGSWFKFWLHHFLAVHLGALQLSLGPPCHRQG